MIKDIVGYENLYKIDEYGNIYGIDGKLRSVYITNKGYKAIDLNKNGKRKKYLIHRLVALHFVDNPYNYPIVLHKDNDKLNTHYSNLVWGTYSQNNSQAIRDGLNKLPKPDNRKFYEIYNETASIICCGAKEVVDTIGFGNDSTVRNLLFRQTKISEGKYKGYKLRKPIKAVAIRFFQ